MEQNTDDRATSYKYFGQACAVGHVDSVLHFLLHPSLRLDATYQHVNINDGYSPLMKACMNGHTDVVSLLLLLSSCDDDNENSNNNIGLLSCDATIRQKLYKSSLCLRKKNVFDLAAIHGYTKILSILCYYNADLMNSYMQKLTFTHRNDYRDDFTYREGDYRNSDYRDDYRGDYRDDHDDYADHGLVCHKNTMAFLEERASAEAVQAIKASSLKRKRSQRENKTASASASASASATRRGRHGDNRRRGGRGWFNSGFNFDFDFDFLPALMPAMFYLIPRVTATSFVLGSCLTCHYLLVSLDNEDNQHRRQIVVNVVGIASQLVLYLLIHLTRNTNPGLITKEKRDDGVSYQRALQVRSHLRNTAISLYRI